MVRGRRDGFAYESKGHRFDARSHVQIRVRDPAASVAFYASHFGMSLIRVGKRIILSRYVYCNVQCRG